VTTTATKDSFARSLSHAGGTNKQFDTSFDVRKAAAVAAKWRDASHTHYITHPYGSEMASTIGEMLPLR
jgi:hypothetical protein